MQFSGRLSKLSDEHKRMSKFWIKFMNENKDLLQNSPIIAEEPQFLYTLAKTEKNGESVIAVYSNNKCVELNDKIEKTIILNGTQKPELIVKVKKAGVYNRIVQDCFGEIQSNKNIVLKEGIFEFDVPKSGILTLSV